MNDARLSIERYGPIAALAVVVALGAWLRLAGLSSWHLSWDGMWHLGDALQPDLGTVLQRNLHHQVHGPLPYALWWTATRAISDPFLLRATVWIPGLACVPLFYGIGREAFGRAAGLTLAVIAAFSFHAVVLTQVMRNYALLLFLLSSAVWLALLWRRTGRRRFAVGYFAALFLAAFTHASGAVAGASLAIAGCAVLRGRPLFAWLLAHALLLAGPVLYATAQLRSAGARVGGADDPLGGFVGHFFFFRPMFLDGPGEVPGRLWDVARFLFASPDRPWAGAALAVASAVGLVLLVRSRRLDVLAWVGATLALGVGLAWLHLFPFTASRHLLYALPALSLPIAFAVQELCRRVDPRLVALGGALAVPLLFPLSPDHYRRAWGDFETRRADLDAVFGFLRDAAGPDDVVVTNRVGLQYVMMAQRLEGEPVEHLGHRDRHARYAYDVWIVPGEQAHRFRGVELWSCDGLNLWSSYLARPGQLERCLLTLARGREGRPLGRLWFLIEKADPFLAFTTRDPAAGFGLVGRDREALRRMLARPFWRAFRAEPGAVFRTGTTGAFAVPWHALEADARATTTPRATPPGVPGSLAPSNAELR